MYARILIPTDGSRCSERAVEHGLHLARAVEGSVAFLFVMNTVPVVREGVVNFDEALVILRPQGQRILERAMARADELRVRADAMLVEGIPEDVILRESAAFELVVMGSRGRGLVRRVLAGSVTQAVLHRIRCPVLVVRSDGA